MTKSPFKGQWTTNLVEIIHIDVYGPLCVAVCGGLIFLHTTDVFKWIYENVYLKRKEINISSKYHWYEVKTS